MQLLLKLLSAVKLNGSLRHPLKSLFPHPASRSSQAAQDGAALTPLQLQGCFVSRPAELPTPMDQGGCRLDQLLHPRNGCLHFLLLCQPCDT